VSIKITIVIPVYNETKNIQKIIDEISKANIQYEYEILFINDGSVDETETILNILSKENKHISHISFVKNFGHQMALKAGFDFAKGDAVICMDGDLQHPPSLIHAMIEKWNEGYEMVITKREDHDNIRFFKKITSKLFYRIINSISSTPISYGEADFRLMDKKVVAVFKEINEPDLFWRGLARWVGFKTTTLSFKAEERFAGNSKYTFNKMVKLALNGILSFSTKPLYFSIFVGFACSIVSIIVLLYALISYIFETVVPGWTSTLIIMSFFSGIQLILIGIVGLYVGKLFIQTKNRPLYIIYKNTYSEEK
jgi:glycosyltransferase involved in cell wall biosynthesis